MDTPKESTSEERLQWDYDVYLSELQIGRARGAVVKKQVVDAYEILDRIRFDYISDTAFRDKIVSAKKGLERALGDFLLDDNYWERKYKEHNLLTPKDWNEKMKCQNTPISNN